MSTAFDPAARSVLIRVAVSGPRVAYTFRFAVDTAATQTSIRPELLRALGYQLTHPVGRKRIRSVTGTALAPLFRVASVAALGQVRSDFLIATQTLPVTVEADGLLGLDFFRGLVLTLDFARGRAALRPPSWWRFWN